MRYNVSPVEFTRKVHSLPLGIDAQLKFCTEHGCSDLFIKVGAPPMVYRYGILYRAKNPTMDTEWHNFTSNAITSELNTKYVREKMVDFSYQVGKYRYRVNCSYSCGVPIATFRMITENLPTFETLNLDDEVTAVLDKAFRKKQGISMLVGATGSGKTSTLAACINTFSGGVTSKETPLKDSHLITLEDPIEYLYETTDSTRVVQKELGKDFLSFSNGIKSSLREHPTHILVGEARDRETIRALVEAARTGHSVISTFHTSSVGDTIARLNSYLSGENSEIMYDLVANLNFIMCQRLLKSVTGYKLDYQYLFFEDSIKKLLLKNIDKSNLATLIDTNLLTNKTLLSSGLCSDWSV